MKHSSLRTRREQGAVLITVALMLLFLLGFIGIAVDIGRLYGVKSEVQTAVDSCALAAAHELDQQDTSITRAVNAGIAAGNLNGVNMQSANWAGEVQLTAESIIFRRDDYVQTTDPLDAVYAECEHLQQNVNTYLIQALGSLVADPSTYPNTWSVYATATATRVSAQTTCPIPVAFKRAPGSTREHLYGFQSGQWVTVYGDRLAGSGEFGWYNLDGSTNARSTRDQLIEGRCDTEVGDQLGTPGAKTAVHEAWNYRFGIYRNGADRNEYRPDFSGYSYTRHNWTNLNVLTLQDGTTTRYWGAFSGTPDTTLSHATADNFLAKRANYGSFEDGGSIQTGSEIVFDRRNALNSFHNLATPGASGEHGQLGASRRVVLVPVLDDGNRVIDYMCAFMLHPLTGPQDDAQIEVLGLASEASSPCTTGGLPGGLAGPLVTALVR